jgi:hypothetical protein
VTVYSSLRASIISVLEGVTDVGEVHGRERFTADPAKFLDLFKTLIGSTTQIRAWLILRERADPIEDTAFGEVRRRHLFVLQGLLGFQDSTDTYGTLQTLVDTVMAAFDAQTTLSASGVIVRSVGPCTLRAFENVQFGSTLCHRCEIELPVDVMLPIGTA